MIRCIFVLNKFAYVMCFTYAPGNRYDLWKGAVRRRPIIY
jgi:hypothetical protein